MQPPAPNKAPATPAEENIRHLAPAAQDAFRRFQTDGDLAALDVVLFAVLEDFLPRALPTPVAGMPGSSRLIEDLGFDSLAITEVVFFTEDLFNIRIANEEIIQVRTLDDLRGFVRAKVSGAPAN
jgi:acyl carrier protein